MRFNLSRNVETITARSLPVGRLRLLIAVLSAGLASLVAPIAMTVAWLAFALFAETWTWVASRPQRLGRPASDRERLSYFLSIIYMNLIWCGLAVLVWLQPPTAAKMAAVMLLAAQLIHAQAFAAFSKSMLAVVGGFPAVTLIVMACATNSTDVGETALLFGAAALLVGYTVIASLLTRAREHRLVAARNEADEASRSKTLIMNLLSHEMRTPLTGLLGMLEAIRLKGADATRYSNIAVMNDAARTMMRLLDDMLDAAKQEAGALDVEIGAIDLLKVVESLNGLWHAKAQEKGVELRILMDAQLPRFVQADGQRLLQVLNNLIGNALKFTTHGAVTVRASAENERLVIEVIDTGPGLSVEAQAQLFRPFSQASQGDLRRAGAGLGLYICRRLCEGMAGTIAVSAGDGGGAAFTVTLPLRAAKEPPIESEIAVATTAGLSILVVDDHPANQLVMRTMLEALGCRAHTAGTATEALALAGREAFDIILLDLHLGDCDGRELLGMLTALNLLKPGARVIAFTADLSSETLAELPRAGFHSILPKPVVAESLVAAIARAS